MTTPREIELKLELPKQYLARLIRSPLLRKVRKGTQRSTTLVSVYYDTDELKLRKHGLTLRVRRTGRGFTQTVKREGDADSTLMDRFEWEHDITGEKPNLDLAKSTGLKLLLTKKLKAKLKPQFETRVRRKVYPIQSGGSEIELSIDRGTVIAGRRSSPICEAELEPNVAIQRSCSNSPALWPSNSRLGFPLPASLTVAMRSSPATNLEPSERPLSRSPPARTARWHFKPSGGIVCIRS